MSLSLYDPQVIIDSYTKNALIEDQAEKSRSLRTEIPRLFIQRYLKPGGSVLDAGGGVGINTIFMSQLGAQVTLLDLTPEILKLARHNIHQAGISSRVDLVQGDITLLNQFIDGQFTFVVCVGDAISYALDQGHKALAELVRVTQPGGIMVLGTDSKFGFLRHNLACGNLKEARKILTSGITTCGMGPPTRLYTPDELRILLANCGCQILEIAATPSLADTIELDIYRQSSQFDELLQLEFEICTRSDLLSVGKHLLVIARKK